jgi:hypothetical protein
VTELITTHSAVPDFLADSSYPITDEASAGANQAKLISCPAEVDEKFLGAKELNVALLGFSINELLEDSVVGTTSSVTVLFVVSLLEVTSFVF